MLPLSHSRVTVPFVRGSFCSSNSGKFDETYPTSLLQHVSPAEWQQTIQSINAAIVPPNIALVLHKTASAVYVFGVALMLYSILATDDLNMFSAGFMATLASLVVAIPAAIHIANKRTTNLNAAVYNAHSTYMSRFPQSAWTVQSAHQLRQSKLCIDLMSNPTAAPQPQQHYAAAAPAAYYTHQSSVYSAPATAPELTPPPPQTPYVTHYNQYSQYPTLQVDHNNIRQPLINY